MSFLLGAFGKLAAGRTYRNLQARLMRVRTRLNRATRQTATMSKMIETQKKMELNNLTAMASFANSNIGATLVGGGLFSAQEVAAFTTGAAWNSGDMDANTRNRYTAFTQAQSEMKAKNEMVLAQWKNAIEEKYENMNDMLLEPLKQEEESLATEKDSLESQLELAKADYDASKQMEKADAKNLQPNYTGG
jgi:uncharacterized protein (DUF342 family)